MKTIKISTKNQVVIGKEKLEELSAQINGGGVTYSPLLDKDYGGTRYIVISPFPERSKIFTGNATAKMLADYCEENSDLLSKGFPLGGWFDQSSGKTYIDVSVTVPLEKEEKAVSLGKKANQKSGFNLSDFSEIPLGGTGEFDSSVVSFEERLKDSLALMTA